MFLSPICRILLLLIASLVIDNKNMFLIKCHDLYGVKHAVFSLNGDSAFGPYGFGKFLLSLFGYCWC